MTEAGSESRLAPARRRARFAKLGAGIVGSLLFGGSMILARTSYAGHSKAPTRPLSVPNSFYSVVRQNLLQAGILAPATAPPAAQTSSS